MAVCARCGEENPDRARFCLACGAPLGAEPPISLETRKTVTALFCDVTGSTGLGERHDPEQVRRVMTRYYERARDVLESHGGTVEKFIGDAVMAIFGIPLVHEDDALRALRAAVELRAAIAELNSELDRIFGVSIVVRIGVNSGEVIAGDPAGGQSFVAGDAVNVAQRLQAAAEPGEILIGDSTYRLARDAISAEPIGQLAVKGRDDVVEAHRLLTVLSGALSHARRFDSPMVGRERELALIGEAFARSLREQSCHLFTVLGPAGVGKSRLVSEALDAIGRRANVLRGACLPYGEGITFWPALEVVKQATGIAEDDSHEQAMTKIEAALMGEDAIAAERVAGLVGLGESAGAAEEGFWGFRKLLEALARRQSLVVVFDDMNWAEPTFLDLVEHVAEWTREAPILLVCLARPDLLDARPAWGGGKRNATSIFLEPLSDGESETLLENLLGATVVGPDVLGRIQESAEGNPLFVEEMISMLIDDGFLHRENGRWQAVGDLSQVSVPATIQILLASRLDQLDVDERQVIERAALEGTTFHLGAVKALADASVRHRCAECLMALVRKELIRPARASFSDEEAFRFRHVLIREAAYDALPKQVRADLHERFAVWLEDAAGDRVAEFEELLGYHLEQAYRSRVELTRVDERASALALRAGARLAAAGRRALGRGDMPAAVNLIERADSLIGDNSGVRDDLLLDLASALWQTGELARADAVLTKAIETADRGGDPALADRAQVERAAIRAYLGHDAERVLEVSERAIAAFEAAGDDIGCARAWRHMATVHWLRCRFGAMEEALERALVYAERAGDEREVATVLDGLCRVALLGPRPVDEGVQRCRNTLERASHDLTLNAVAQTILGSLTAMEGRLDEARDLIARAESTFEELGLGLKLAGVSMYAAYVELIAGEWSAAERELRRGYAALESMGERAQLATVAALLARALLEQERLEEADHYTAVSKGAASTDDAFSQVLWRSSRARLLARQGEQTAAEQLAAEALAIAEQTDSPTMRGDALRDLADVLSLAQKQVEAAARLEEAVQLYETKGNVVSARQARDMLSRLDLGTPTC
jgi:predicted ATPase